MGAVPAIHRGHYPIQDCFPTKVCAHGRTILLHRGQESPPDSLRSILLPTVNYRNYGEGIVGKNNCIRRYVSA